MHPQVPARAVVLAAEDVEQRVLAHAEAVAGLQGPFDVRLDPSVQEGEGAPALGEGGERAVRGRHGLLRRSVPASRAEVCDHQDSPHVQ